MPRKKYCDPAADIAAVFADEKIALLANGEDTAAHAEELAKFKAVRAAAKKAVDELLKREK